MNVLLLAAGDSAAYEDAGERWPKNLVEIEGKPLLEHVIQSLNALVAAGARLVCLVRQEEDRRYQTADVIRLLEPTALVRTVPVVASGAACTALHAIDVIDPDEPLLVIN